MYKKIFGWLLDYAYFKGLCHGYLISRLPGEQGQDSLPWVSGLNVGKNEPFFSSEGSAGSTLLWAAGNIDQTSPRRKPAFLNQVSELR